RLGLRPPPLDVEDAREVRDRLRRLRVALAARRACRVHGPAVESLRLGDLPVVAEHDAEVVEHRGELHPLGWESALEDRQRLAARAGGVLEAPFVLVRPHQQVERARVRDGALVPRAVERDGLLELRLGLRIAPLVEERAAELRAVLRVAGARELERAPEL